MSYIKGVKERVYKVLEHKPATRSSDYLLYLEVCKEMQLDIIDLPFDYVMRNHKHLGMPAFESVGRARRKAQEKVEAFRAADKVLDARYENYKEVREYAAEE